MKKVRILLRVSSHQQLEADGDLSVQREIVLEYIQRHENWKLDDKEYFEGAESGYRNSVKDRDVLSLVEEDARNREFDILVVYKDDRLGRRMWEIGAYIMQLKSWGVDVYTTKDGCISPDNNDIMGQMMLALRYGNAQKSSLDTGQRVKDTAKELVKQGRFLGGNPPYGYKLVLSGELSKHGRALHKLRIIPERIEVVKKIYELSFEKEYGSAKIAKNLNLDPYYRTMAPNDMWKSGTITSILTNPIYCGITAYKRRERNDGKYHRLNRENWIYATAVNPEIAVIDWKMWNKVQDARAERNVRYKNALGDQCINRFSRNDGDLSLIDVAYCGYCGKKLTNGSCYNYWTIKGTGEKRAHKISRYKCLTAQQGMPHNKSSQFQAERVEQIVYEEVGKYIDKMQNQQDLYQVIYTNNQKEKYAFSQKRESAQKELNKIKQDIELMKLHIPDAMAGNYPLSVEILADTIRDFEEKQKAKESGLAEMENHIKNMGLEEADIWSVYESFPTWKAVFFKADKQIKRVLINKLVKKVIITREKVTINFKVNPENAIDSLGT